MKDRHPATSFVPSLLLLTFLGVGACSAGPAAGPKTTEPAAPATDPLKIAEMIDLRDRMEVARLRTQIAQVLAQLEGSAATGEAWAVISVAMLQLRSDADAAWNRLREVVAVLGDRGGASYWAHLGMAEVYLVWELPDQAKTEVDAALALFPGTAPAFERLGRIGLVQKKNDVARAAFTEAWTAGGATGAPFAGLALARLEQADDPAAAAARVDQILAAHSELIEALVLAAELKPTGPEKTALLQRALARAPESGELAGALAASLEAEGKGAEALKTYLDSARTHPADLEAWRGVARLAREKEDEAIEREALEKVVELDPLEVEAVRRLAGLRTKSGDLEGAEESWSELLIRQHDDTSALLSRGKVREAREAYRTALADYRAAAAAEVEGAAEAVTALSSRVGLPSKALKGATPDAVYGRVARVLGKAYVARLKETPELGGTLSIKVWVEAGAVVEAELVEDTLHDPLMEALAFWLVHDAGFPVSKGRKEFTLPFTFDPADYAP